MLHVAGYCVRRDADTTSANRKFKVDSWHLPTENGYPSLGDVSKQLSNWRMFLPDNFLGA